MWGDWPPGAWALAGRGLARARASRASTQLLMVGVLRMAGQDRRCNMYPRLISPSLHQRSLPGLQCAWSRTYRLEVYLIYSSIGHYTPGIVRQPYWLATLDIANLEIQYFNFRKKIICGSSTYGGLHFMIRHIRAMTPMWLAWAYLEACQGMWRDTRNRVQYFYEGRLLAW